MSSRRSPARPARAGWPAWVAALALALLACDDAAPGLGADAEGAGGGAGRDAGGGLRDLGRGDQGGPRPDGQPALDAGGGGAGGGAADLGADAGPAPECAEDAQCGAEAVCDRGRCVEGRRCDADFSCPEGRLCVADICLPDPRSTGGLVAEPPQLVFTFSTVGEQVFRDGQVRNEGEDTFEIVRLEVVDSATFTVETTPPLPARLVSGQTFAFTVRYTADDATADAGTLRIYTDRPGAPPLEVALQSSFKQVGGQDPCLRLEPVRLDFGPVARGRDRVLGFDLVSCGRAPVTVQAIRRGAGFLGPLPATFDLLAPPAFPIVLAPEQRQRIEVIYSPRRAAFEAGFWEVFSDDRQTPRQRVDVSALGTPPALEDVALHIRLNWNTDLTDVDLHLVGPGGPMWSCEGDCYFSNPQPEWGDPADFRDNPFLDVDDVDGFGPENINLEAPAAGTYRILVHYWAAHGGRDPDAVVEVLEFGVVVASYGPQRLSAIDQVWEVADLHWPAQTRTDLLNLTQPPRGRLCGGF